MGWLKKAFDFVAGSQLTQMILGLIGALLALKAVQWEARMDGERIATDRIAKKQAKVKVAVGARQNEIITEERENADEAIRARDTGPLYPSAAELPDDIGPVAIRDFRGGKAPQ